MNLVIRMILIAGAAGLVLPTAAADGAADWNRLQGAWECVETLKDGKSVPMYVGVRAVIKDNTLTWLFPRNGKFFEVKATFKIDSSKSPKQFDWTPDGKKEVHMRLYELDGNMLKWSTNLGADTPRPAKFSEGKWQFTMKRLK